PAEVAAGYRSRARPAPGGRGPRADQAVRGDLAGAGWGGNRALHGKPAARRDHAGGGRGGDAGSALVDRRGSPGGARRAAGGAGAPQRGGEGGSAGGWLAQEPRLRAGRVSGGEDRTGRSSISCPCRSETTFGLR